jgi:hypothetical protein
MLYCLWPKTLAEAVKICLLTMTAQEKQMLKNTSEENLIASHFGRAVNMRNRFGMWQGNNELIESCYDGNCKSGVAGTKPASLNRDLNIVFGEA